MRWSGKLYEALKALAERASSSARPTAAGSSRVMINVLAAPDPVNEAFIQGPGRSAAGF